MAIRPGPGAILAALAAACVALAVLAASVGAVHILPSEVALTVLGRIGFGPGAASAAHAAVLESIRFPRVALACIVGAALGIAGAGMQGLFRNPLADPALIGASSGAALAVAITIVAGNHWVAGFVRAAGVWALPIAAFVGCLAATALVRRLASTHESTSVGAMLLAGVAINVVCEAAIGALTFAASDEQLRNFTFWRMGSLAGATWPVVAASGGCAVAGVCLLIPNATGLDRLAMGEEPARHAGVDTARLARRVTAGAALLVAAAVASAGIIWFIGLVAPHLVRLAGGAQQRFVMPAAALTGAALALAADAVSRTVVVPAELPIGVPIALLGTPLFVALLRRARDAGRL